MADYNHLLNISYILHNHLDLEKPVITWVFGVEKREDSAIVANGLSVWWQGKSITAGDAGREKGFSYSHSVWHQKSIWPALLQMKEIIKESLILKSDGCTRDDTGFEVDTQGS